MGEFLSTPIRDKISEDGENEIVNFLKLICSYAMELVACKAGEKEWKTHIYQI
jgi:hypothetical protein